MVLREKWEEKQHPVILFSGNISKAFIYSDHEVLILKTFLVVSAKILITQWALLQQHLRALNPNGRQPSIQCSVATPCVPIFMNQLCRRGWRSTQVCQKSSAPPKMTVDATVVCSQSRCWLVYLVEEEWLHWWRQTRSLLVDSFSQSELGWVTDQITRIIAQFFFLT